MFVRPRQSTYNHNVHQPKQPKKDKADDALTTNNEGKNDRGDGSTTTLRRQYDDNNDKGGSDVDRGGGSCGDEHVVLGGFVSSRNSNRRSLTVPLTYRKGAYRPPRGKQNC